MEALEKPIPLPSREKLAALYRISLFINETLCVDELLDRIVKVAVKLLPADRCAVVYKPDMHKIKTKIYNFNEDHAKEISRTIISKVIEGKEPLLIKDALEHPEFKEKESIRRLKLRSLCSVPIILDDKLLGAIYVDTKRIGKGFSEEDCIFLQAVANLAALALKNAGEFETLQVNFENILFTIETRHKYGFLIGKSEKMQRVYEWVEKVKDLKGPILIIGETGTGKEVLTRTIYEKSTKWKKGFYVVNCPAIPKELLESELFGHKKGAFTGALSDKPGKLAIADGGTVFFDEIGDLPVEMQAKLLRVVETGEFEPIGSSKTKKVDIRIIAASEKDLEEMTKNGSFRSALYYRFLTSITLPPLRERIEDVPLFAQHFLHLYSTLAKKKILGFTKEAMDLMMLYSWPGNVRELEKKIEKAISFAKNGDYITPELLDIGIKRVRDETGFKSLRELEKEHIEEVLKYTNGNRQRASEILGISRKALFNKIRRYKIKI
jgi:transcriptional regulator with GAF, ATPase, and Fis domain